MAEEKLRKYDALAAEAKAAMEKIETLLAGDTTIEACMKKLSVKELQVCLCFDLLNIHREP